MRVIVLWQHDPTTTYAGGIGTFINTFTQHAPEDFRIQLIGVSVNPEKYPVGTWHRLFLKGKEVDFLPIVAAHPARRYRIPLSLRYTWALRKFKKQINFQDAVVELHRIEPVLALQNITAPKFLFLHAHPQDLRNPMSEVTWGRFPFLYFWLERKLIGQMDRIYVVREDAVAWYRSAYPQWAERFSFLPTWADEKLFVPQPEECQRQEREQLARKHRLQPNQPLLLFVGRFEGQKDPIGLLEAIRQMNGKQAEAQLVMIGEGSLEGSMRSFLREHRMEHRVTLLSPQPQTELVRWMNSADALVLASAFEGMPRVVVESLQAGLPVVSTDVGEVRRLLGSPDLEGQSPGGRLVTGQTPEAFRAGMEAFLRSPTSRAACRKQAQPYTPRALLAPVYEAYRKVQDQKNVSG